MKKLRASGRPLAALLALSMLCASSPAFSQTDEQRAAARALATEGASAFNEGRYKDAADLFARAESLLHAPPHLLFLARSYTKLGQLVKARETYLKISKEQLASNAPQPFKDAQRAAQDEIRSVEPRIARLTIQVSADAKDLAVKLDGVAVPAVLLGVPQPLDPGEHRLEATASGKRAQPKSFSVRDGERVNVALELVDDPNARPVAAGPTAPAGANAPATTAPSGVTPGVSSSAATSRPVPNANSEHASGGSSGLRAASFVSFGVAAVGVGVGVAFLVRSSSKNSQSNDLFDTCRAEGGGRCAANAPLSAQIRNLDDQANSARSVGIAGLVVGGVGAALGVTFLALSSGSSSESKSGRLIPVIAPGFAGVAGAF